MLWLVLHPQVHLHSQIEDVRINSAGGQVSVVISPEASISITVEGSFPINGEGGFKMLPGNRQHQQFRPCGTEQEIQSRLQRGEVSIHAVHHETSHYPTL